MIFYRKSRSLNPIRKGKIQGLDLPSKLKLKIYEEKLWTPPERLRPPATVTTRTQKSLTS